MHEEQWNALVAAMRTQAAAHLKEALRAARPDVLQKLAVDIVPALVRIASYAGEPAGIGENWAEAIARSRVAGLPPILVRIHRGPFGPAEGRDVVESLQQAQSSQVAIAFVNDRATNVRPYIGADAQWTLDLDGLVNLMLNAGVGVRSETYTAIFIDGGYFDRVL
jgi:hypothetical protein